MKLLKYFASWAKREFPLSPEFTRGCKGTFRFWPEIPVNRCRKDSLSTAWKTSRFFCTWYMTSGMHRRYFTWATFTRKLFLTCPKRRLWSGFTTIASLVKQTLLWPTFLVTLGHERRKSGRCIASRPSSVIRLTTPESPLRWRIPRESLVWTNTPSNTSSWIYSKNTFHQSKAFLGTNWTFNLPTSND